LIVYDLFVNGLRNLKEKRILFNEKKNIIFGSNGVGKTSILEALFLLGFRKSFLNVNIKDIVNYDSDKFYIKSTIKSENKGIFELKGVYINGKLNIYLSNKKKNILDINEFYYPLFFSSSNYTSYIESTPLIRKLIDRFIFGMSNLYYNELINYNKALKNKSFLLKNNGSNMEINSWNKVLSEMSYNIMCRRRNFIDNLNKLLKLLINNFNVKYSPSFSYTDFSQEKIFLEYERLMSAERIYKKNLKGIHLDKYSLEMNNKNLKFFSSGEKKMGLIFFYISYIEYFFKERGEYPVFFTDDIDTAIDKDNLKIIIKNYPELQVIATSVNKIDDYDNYIYIN